MHVPPVIDSQAESLINDVVRFAHLGPTVLRHRVGRKGGGAGVAARRPRKCRVHGGRPAIAVEDISSAKVQPRVHLAAVGEFAGRAFQPAEFRPGSVGQRFVGSGRSIHIDASLRRRHVVPDYVLLGSLVAQAIVEIPVAPGVAGACRDAIGRLIQRTLYPVGIIAEERPPERRRIEIFQHPRRISGPVTAAAIEFEIEAQVVRGVQKQAGRTEAPHGGPIVVRGQAALNGGRWRRLR